MSGEEDKYSRTKKKNTDNFVLYILYIEEFDINNRGELILTK